MDEWRRPVDFGEQRRCRTHTVGWGCDGEQEFCEVELIPQGWPPFGRLRAALDEIELVAWGAKEPNSDGGGGATWVADHVRGGVDGGIGPIYLAEGLTREGRTPSGAQDEHIALHDPQRALDMVEALREVIALCEQTIGGRDMSRYGDVDAPADYPDAADALAMQTLLALARGFRIER
ncbi:DUF6221 family protein [Catellatospora tritici]|uniref:DUF6221 family protein n=1 Tax=Catellatospora tritici TaxID=2851566 RepID=UPI001C2D3D42|nr:DUF6221 family protein [Catellatospora tritici]MBV1854603.1 hypothetical protein [Catellatospora tritici]